MFDAQEELATKVNLEDLDEWGGDIFGNQAEPILNDFLVLEERMFWQLVIAGIAEEFLDGILLLLVVEIVPQFGHAVDDCDAGHSLDDLVLAGRDSLHNFADVAQDVSKLRVLSAHLIQLVDVENRVVQFFIDVGL